MAYYPSGCDAELSDHICGTCSTELARIRRAAFINSSYYATLLADPTDATLWTAGIATGEIIVLPEVQGEYDGGAAQMGQGYGDVEERVNSYLFTAEIMDPTYYGNRAFYNSLKNTRNFYFAFGSETVLHISDEPCTIIPTNPIANDLKTEVVWKAQVKWTSDNFPTESTTPDGVFVCYVP